MSVSPLVTEAPPSEYAGTLGGFCKDSSDSDEEPSPEDKLAVSWENLPVLERLGLTSATQMSEEEVESVFTQVALGFRCDQYTLAQRRRAEEHDKAVAQYNIDLELQLSKDMLQSLRGRCAGAEKLAVLSRIEASLDTVLGGVRDIIAAAEVLGAVHQEARGSHAVEIIEAHLEHLKRRHSVDNAKLLQTRKLLHSSRGRRHSDSADGDNSHLFVRRDSQQTLLRRRVSITVIPTGSQLSDLETRFQEGCKSSADTDSLGPEGGSVNHPLSRLIRQISIHSSQLLEDEGELASPTSSLPATLHHRRRSSILERKARSEEAKSERSTAGSLGSRSKLSTYISDLVCTPEQQQLSLASRLSYCRCMVALLLLLAISFLLLLGLLLWGLTVPLRCSSF